MGYGENMGIPVAPLDVAPEDRIVADDYECEDCAGHRGNVTTQGVPEVVSEGTRNPAALVGELGGNVIAAAMGGDEQIQVAFTIADGQAQL